MAHLIRKYNPTNTTEPVSLGNPPLSVDPISAAWYRDSLPSSRTTDTTRNGLQTSRTLTGTDVISAKLYDSLRSLDTYAARKPPRGVLTDEYSKYSTFSSPPTKPVDSYASTNSYSNGYGPKSSLVSNNYGNKPIKSVTFAKLPNSEAYGGGASSRLPQMKNEPNTSITSSFPSRSNDVTPSYLANDIPTYPNSSANRFYTTSYSSSYPSNQVKASNDISPGINREKSTLTDERMKRNTYAMRSRENSMYNQLSKEPVIGTDEYYTRKMTEIINQPTSSLFPNSPSQVTDYMYVGGYRDAENWMYLKRLGITHVLNTAAMRRSTYNPYPPESGIVGYESFDADDAEHYDVMQHFPRAKAFIDRCKWSGGKVLVHCAMGVNRSGTMCCAYLMADQKMSLLEAVKRMKQRRWTTLTNRGFQRQLLRYARQKGHL